MIIFKLSPVSSDDSVFDRCNTSNIHCFESRIVQFQISIMDQQHDTSKIQVFHVPDQPFQTFIGLIDMAFPIFDYRESMIKYYQQYCKLFAQTRTILFSEAAELVGLQNEMDKSLPTIISTGAFVGPSNLFAGFQGLIRFLEIGQCYKDIVLFIMTQKPDQAFDDSMSKALEQFLAVTQHHVIHLHILCVGGVLPESSATLIRRAFNQPNDNVFLAHLEVDPENENYEKISSQVFLSVQESLQNHICKYSGAQQISNMEFVNCPYVMADQVQELNLQKNGKAINIQPLSKITYKELSQLCKTQISILTRQRKEEEIKASIDLMKKLEQQYIEQKEENSEFLQIIDKFYKLEVKTFWSQVPLKQDTRDTRVRDLDALMQLGQTTLEFGQAVDEFLVDLQRALDNKEVDFQNSDQEPSAIGLINQKDILSDPEYINVLRNVKNPYELCSYFPIVGYGVTISRPNRFDGACWSLNVGVPKNACKVFDSSSIFMNKDIGRINCILPLYSSNDRDLKFFVRSKFYDAMLTMAFIRSADIRSPEAHAVLSAKYFLHLLSEPESNFNTHQMNLVYNTFQMKYEGYKYFELIKTQLLSDSPENAFLDPLYIDKIQPVHLICYLLVVIKNENPKLLRGKIDRIFQLLMVAEFDDRKTVMQQLGKKQVKIINQEFLVEQIISLIPEEVLSVYQIQEAVVKICSSFDFTSFLQVELQYPSKLPCKDEDIDYQRFEDLYFYLTEEVLSIEKKSIYDHMILHPNKRRALLQPFTLTQQIQKQETSDYFKNEQNLFLFYKQVLERVSVQRPYLKDSIEPILLRTQEELEVFLIEQNLDPSNYQIMNNNSGRIVNSCTCEQCYFYLKPFDFQVHPCACYVFRQITQEDWGFEFEME